MEPDTRKILDQIDEFLLRRDKASRELAAVLSALRGPDNRDEDDYTDVTKSYTTIPIRRAAFPKCAARQDALNNFVVEIGDGNRIMNMQRAAGHKDASFKLLSHTHEDTHFNIHAWMAAKALGLTNEEL